MSSPITKNYLRSNRKRLALSQNDVSFLMGALDGGKISRYERFAREPSLRTALAFEAIYKRAASEIFEGLYQTIEQEVAKRAKILANRKDGKPNERAARKRETLKELARI